MLTDRQLKRLHRALHPKGVAVIGATIERDRVGHQIIESLLMGGFAGRIFPIHPRHRSILGLPVFPSLEAVGENPDLAIIALNEQAAIPILKESGRNGISGAICVAGGFKEVGVEGEALEKALQSAAQENGILLIGPNTLGVINVRARLNATFWPLELGEAGCTSIISQSGGVGQIMWNRAFEEGLAINQWIGVGNRAMLDFDDILQYFACDPTTKVISVYMEGTERARRFVQLAGEVMPHKPVVILKAGRGKVSQESVATHTGTLAGAFNMYQDIFKQYGLLCVKGANELVSVSKALSLAPLPKGDRVAVLTPTAGPSILLVDLLEDLKCELAEFSSKTLETLSGLLNNAPAILKNPLDAANVGYSADSYVEIADCLLDDPGVDLLIAISIQHKDRRFPDEELVRLKEKHQKPILVYFISLPEQSKKPRDLCQRGGIPLYLSVEDTAHAAAGLILYRRYLESHVSMGSFKP